MGAKQASKLLIGMPVKFSGAVMAHMDLEHSAQVFEFVAVRQAAAVARSVRPTPEADIWLMI